MEREKQIYEAGQLYSDSMDEFQRYHTYPKGAFIDGANWADENPKKGLVSIDKVCEWLNSADMRMYVIADHTSSNINRFNMNKFISDFREAMEV